MKQKSYITWKSYKTEWRKRIVTISSFSANLSNGKQEHKMNERRDLQSHTYLAYYHKHVIIIWQLAFSAANSFKLSKFLSLPLLQANIQEPNGLI